MPTRPHLPESEKGLFRALEIPGWIGWIDERYWYPAIEDDMADPRALFDGDRVLNWYKRDRNRLAEIAWPTDSEGKSASIVLKSYEPGSVANQLRLMQGEPRALRHWNSCWLLQERGIRTPRPIFIALTRNAGNDQGVLAVETIKDCDTVRELVRNRSADEDDVGAGRDSYSIHAFSAFCGQYAREIHDRNIVHRDFSGANILIPRDWIRGSGPLCSEFVMLDINRVRDIPAGDMDIRLRIQDLERLGIPELALEDYFFAYAGDDPAIKNEWPRFLKYRRGYRRIRETRNPFTRGLLKLCTYWPRTG